MGTIVKLGEFYLEWSTYGDAPNTAGMSLDELRKYIGEEWGKEGLRLLPERLERVERKGTSSRRHQSAVETIWLNRAGPEEATLTIVGIYRHYCLGEPVQPEWIVRVPGDGKFGDDSGDSLFAFVTAGWPLPELVQTP